MAYTSWSTSNYLRQASALLTAMPFTMSCWFYTTSSGVNQTLMSIVNSGSASGANEWWMGVGSNNLLAAGQNSTVNATVAGAVGLNAWHHAAAVFTSTTSRAAFLDNVKGTNTTSNAAPTGINSVNVGVNVKTTTVSPLVGRIAEVAIWNVALSDDEIAVLAKGFPPRTVRPQGLVAHLPMIGNLVDLKGNPFAMVGTLALAEHPRLILPRRR